MDDNTDTTRRRFEQGMEIRAEVLGKAHVERSMKNADEFSRPIQELVTEYCWGEIWGRPGLDRRARSMLNIAMLSALNRPHEVRLHIRGAIGNGVSREEIREVIMQVAIYCGVPAALETTRLAQEVFHAIDAEELPSSRG